MHFEKWLQHPTTPNLALLWQMGRGSGYNNKSMIIKYLSILQKKPLIYTIFCKDFLKTDLLHSFRVWRVIYSRSVGRSHELWGSSWQKKCYSRNNFTSFFTSSHKSNSAWNASLQKRRSRRRLLALLSTKQLPKGHALRLFLLPFHFFPPVYIPTEIIYW